MMLRVITISLVAAGAAIAIDGCGDSGGTKAPPITGAPHKKWKDLTKDEKIATLEKEPVPNKAQRIQDVKDGKM